MLAMNTVAMPCMMAVPSILMVAPKGTTKAATPCFTPQRFIKVFKVTGMEAELLEVLKAKIMAGYMFLKN